jgi:mono/diheme cytochrome c family protein
MFLKSQLLLILFSSFAMAGEGVQFSWTASSPAQELKHFESNDFSKFKSVSSQEKDPATGKLTPYKGVLLSQLIEKAMDPLPLDHKAQLDLVILSGASGGQVLLPRSVITKYPVMVALNGGSPSVVMPWTSKPKLLQEGLPVESYFVTGVTRVELSNYRERFGRFFLKRRTDPSAMRGEKIFVQQCISCHAGGVGGALADLSGEAKARKLASTGHPVIKGSPKLNEKELRSLVNYLDAYRSENSPLAEAHR